MWLEQRRPIYQRNFFRGNFLRLVFAKSANCCSLIEFAIWRDAPLRLAFDRSPRLAASAAPAAIYCFFDLAGMQTPFFTLGHKVGTFISVCGSPLGGYIAVRSDAGETLTWIRPGPSRVTLRGDTNAGSRQSSGSGPNG
jgi:hypothetical protein